MIKITASTLENHLPKIIFLIFKEFKINLLSCENSELPVPRDEGLVEKTLYIGLQQNNTINYRLYDARRKKYEVNALQLQHLTEEEVELLRTELKSYAKNPHWSKWCSGADANAHDQYLIMAKILLLIVRDLNHEEKYIHLNIEIYNVPEFSQPYPPALNLILDDSAIQEFIKNSLSLQLSITFPTNPEWESGDINDRNTENDPELVNETFPLTPFEHFHDLLQILKGYDFPSTLTLRFSPGSGFKQHYLTPSVTAQIATFFKELTPKFKHVKDFSCNFSEVILDKNVIDELLQLLESHPFDKVHVDFSTNRIGERKILWVLPLLTGENFSHSISSMSLNLRNNPLTDDSCQLISDALKQTPGFRNLSIQLGGDFSSQDQVTATGLETLLSGINHSRVSHLYVKLSGFFGSHKPKNHPVASDPIEMRKYKELLMSSGYLKLDLSSWSNASRYHIQRANACLMDVIKKIQKKEYHIKISEVFLDNDPLDFYLKSLSPTQAIWIKFTSSPPDFEKARQFIARNSGNLPPHLNLAFVYSELGPKPEELKALFDFKKYIESKECLVGIHLILPEATSLKLRELATTNQQEYDLQPWYIKPAADPLLMLEILLHSFPLKSERAKALAVNVIERLLYCNEEEAPFDKKKTGLIVAILILEYEMLDNSEYNLWLLKHAISKICDIPIEKIDTLSRQHLVSLISSSVDSAITPQDKQKPRHSIISLPWLKKAFQEYIEQMRKINESINSNVAAQSFFSKSNQLDSLERLLKSKLFTSFSKEITHELLNHEAIRAIIHRKNLDLSEVLFIEEFIDFAYNSEANDKISFEMKKKSPLSTGHLLRQANNLSQSSTSEMILGEFQEAIREHKKETTCNDYLEQDEQETTDDDYLKEDEQETTDDDYLEEDEQETTDDDYLEEDEQETTDDDYLEEDEQETTDDDYLEEDEQETTDDDYLKQVEQETTYDDYLEQVKQETTYDGYLEQVEQKTTYDNYLEQVEQETTYDDYVEKEETLEGYTGFRFK